MNVISQALEERNKQVNALLQKSSERLKEARDVHGQMVHAKLELDRATEDVSLIKIMELNVSKRAQDTLTALQILTLGDFKTFPSEDALAEKLREHPSCGEECATAIIALFKEFREWVN